MVIIEHSKNVRSSYAHLNPNMYVKKGSEVKKGEIIAKVGPKYVENGKLNGATTGVHLHLGVQVNGTYVDPLKYIVM